MRAKNNQYLNRAQNKGFLTLKMVSVQIICPLRAQSCSELHLNIRALGFLRNEEITLLQPLGICHNT